MESRVADKPQLKQMAERIDESTDKALADMLSFHLKFVDMIKAEQKKRKARSYRGK